MGDNRALQIYFNFFDVNSNAVIDKNELVELLIDSNKDGMLSNKEIKKFIKSNRLKPSEVPYNTAVNDMKLFLTKLAQAKQKYVAQIDSPSTFTLYDGSQATAIVYNYKNEDFMMQAVSYPTGQNLADVRSSTILQLYDDSTMYEYEVPGRVVKNYYDKYGEALEHTVVTVGPYEVKIPIGFYDNIDNGENPEEQKDTSYELKDYGPYQADKKDIANIKSILAKTKVTDITLQHDGALDTIKKLGKNVPKELVIFDSHSDMYLNEQDTLKEVTLATWVNTYATKYKAEKIYWVFPEKMTEYEGIAALLYGGKNEYSGEENDHPLYMESFGIQAPDIRKTPFEIHLYFDFTNDILTNIKPQHDNYHGFTLIISTESSLPDMAGKNLILTIDADYLANAGYDTIEAWNSPKDYKEFNATASQLLEIIKTKNIRPVAVNLTLSPYYVPKQNRKHTEDFFKTIKKFAGK